MAALEDKHDESECPVCGGEGGYYEPESRFSRWHLDPPCEEFVPCEACNGTGTVRRPTSLLERLDQLNRMMAHPVNDDVPF